LPKRKTKNPNDEFGETLGYLVITVFIMMFIIALTIGEAGML